MRRRSAKFHARMRVSAADEAVFGIISWNAPADVAAILAALPLDAQADAEDRLRRALTAAATQWSQIIRVSHASSAGQLYSILAQQRGNAYYITLP